MGLRYGFCTYVHEGYIGDRELFLLNLLLGILEHDDVLGDDRCITIIGDHLGGEVDNVDHVETSAMQLEVVTKRLGGDISLYGLVVADLVDSCVFNGVNDEVVAEAFIGFL